MKTKTEMKWFSIFDHQKEEWYLRRMHQNGWRFVKVSGLLYYFEACMPEDVIYRLDFPGDVAGSKGEYLDLFRDCGWTYLQDFAGYCYFRKPVSEMDGEEEIFSDDSSRIAMMERVYQRRMLPMLVVFFAVLLPQFISNMSHGRYVLSASLGGFLIFYTAIFVYCGVRYHQQKK